MDGIQRQMDNMVSIIGSSIRNSFTETVGFEILAWVLMDGS